MTNQDFFKQFKPHEAGAGFRAQIPFNGGAIEASISAGEYYYSTPRQDMDNASQYSAYEVAFFQVTGDKKEWASYKTLEDAGVFKIIGYGKYEGTEESEKSKSKCSVFGRVAIDKIIEIVSK